MVTLFSHFVLLGQAPAPAEPNPLQPLIYAFPFLAVLFYFMILRPQKKQDQTHKEALKSLKENDRVVTIGGIHGIVTNVQRDAERVTLRVDESTGTKMRFNLSAISRVITSEEAEGAAGKTASKA